jgi:hypothetical protein
LRLELTCSLNDLLVLAVSGQLNATYAGKMGVDAEYIPRHAGNSFEADRKHRKGGAGGKRDKAGFRAMGQASRGVARGSFESMMLRAGNSELGHHIP